MFKNAINDWLLGSAASLWSWLLGFSFGFVPNWAIIAVLLAVGTYVFLKLGMRGLVAYAAVIVGAMELQRRADGKLRPNPPDKQWPEKVPKPRKTVIDRVRGKNEFDPDTNEWKPKKKGSLR